MNINRIENFCVNDRQMKHLQKKAPQFCCPTLCSIIIQILKIVAPLPSQRS